MTEALRKLRRLRRLKRLTGLPWSVVLEGALIARGHWRSLPPRDRAKLAALARKSRGWPPRLSASERAEARALIARFDGKALARELVGLRRAGPRSRAAWARGAAQLVRVSNARRPDRVAGAVRRRIASRRPAGGG